MARGTERGWNDPAYLKTEQYRDSRRLAARRSIHEKYGRADWLPWLAAACDWPEQGRVLEIGCGAGWFWTAAKGIAPAALELTLTDLSEGMVSEALQTVRSLEAWRVDGQVADATALPFATASFDAVLAFHMLYHLPDPEAGVAEIARVLRPGGRAFIVTNGVGHMRELFEISAEVFEETGWDIVHRRFSLESAPALLEPRFEAVELRRYLDELHCTDPEDVLAYLASSPPGEGATRAERFELEAAVQRAFARGGGALHISKSVGLFVCRR